MVVKANYPEEAPGTLEVVVSVFLFYFYETSFLVLLLSSFWITIMCHAKLFILYVVACKEAFVFFGRSTHNQGSIPYGKQHQTLPVD